MPGKEGGMEGRRERIGESASAGRKKAEKNTQEKRLDLSNKPVTETDSNAPEKKQ